MLCLITLFYLFTGTHFLLIFSFFVPFWCNQKVCIKHLNLSCDQDRIECFLCLQLPWLTTWSVQVASLVMGMQVTIVVLLIPCSLIDLFSLFFPTWWEDFIAFIYNGYLFWEHNVNISGYCDEDLNLNHQKVGGKEKIEQGFSLHELEPHALRSLHELVSLVHHRINQNQPAGNVSADQSVSREEDEVKKIVKTNLFNLEEDPIANIVWNLEPRAFQSVFLTMAVSLCSLSNFSFPLLLQI